MAPEEPAQEIAADVIGNSEIPLESKEPTEAQVSLEPIVLGNSKVEDHNPPESRLGVKTMDDEDQTEQAPDEVSPEPARDTTENSRSIPNTKQDRKNKAKNTKASFWADESEPVMPKLDSGAQSMNQESLDVDAPVASLHPDLGEPFAEPTQDDGKEFEDVPKSKKDKKKAKKSKALAWADDLDAAAREKNDTDQKSTNEGYNVAISQTSLHTEAKDSSADPAKTIVDELENVPKSKKDKKKGKKSRARSWTEEPETLPSDTDVAAGAESGKNDSQFPRSLTEQGFSEVFTEPQGDVKHVMASAPRTGKPRRKPRN